MTTAVDTRDLDEARAQIGSRYCDHRLEVTAPSVRFHAVQTAAVVASLGVHRLRYGAGVRVQASPLRTSVLVSSPRRGRLTVRMGGGERVVGPGESVALDPDREFTLDWSPGCELSTVQIDRRVLGAALGGHLADRTPLAFDLDHRASVHDHRRWRGLVHLLEADADADRSIGGSPLLARRLEELVVGLVLATHPLAAAAPPAAPSQVRRAVAYLQDHAREPVSTADLATAVGASPRALQVAFRDHLGTSPMRYLQQVRLHAARLDLREAEPGSTTVAEVSYRWGFAHLGRFARDYRAAFGELPSRTLRG